MKQGALDCSGMCEQSDQDHIEQAAEIAKKGKSLLASIRALEQVESDLFLEHI